LKPRILTSVSPGFDPYHDRVFGFKGTAQPDSTEVRVCVAARNIAQWVRKPSDDHEKFESGWK